MIESQRHSYHLVDPSPLTILGSLGALATTIGGVMYMHSFQGGTIFSIICGIRQYLGHLTKEHHVGFEAAAWNLIQDYLDKDLFRIADRPMGIEISSFEGAIEINMISANLRKLSDPQKELEAAEHIPSYKSQAHKAWQVIL
ncbi:Cytochrome c oxidase subunit 3 [Capsicum chinense]|nr:Cytochrome c oxidase subunit 3 [Capsicum chinense]